MNTKELKEKLKDNFEKILEDESKLVILDSTFSKIIAQTETSSETENQKSEEKQYVKDPVSNEPEVKSWEDFKNKMKAKYGF